MYRKLLLDIPLRLVLIVGVVFGVFFSISDEKDIQASIIYTGPPCDLIDGAFDISNGEYNININRGHHNNDGQTVDLGAYQVQPIGGNSYQKCKDDKAYASFDGTLSIRTIKDEDGAGCSSWNAEIQTHYCDYGYFAVLTDSNTGVQAIYGHLADGSITVPNNSQVSKGQHIATIGSTGNSTFTHIHFALRDDWGNPSTQKSYNQWKFAPNGLNTATLNETFKQYIADFDGDGLDDILSRETNGQFFIDYAHNGWRSEGSYGGDWDIGFKKSAVYGAGTNSGIFVGNFDGDNMADIMVQESNGQFYIDYAHNGWRRETTTGGDWDTGFKKSNVYGYGSAHEIFIGDLNGGGIDDVAVRETNGWFYIDYAEGGWKDVSSGGDWDTGFKKSNAIGANQGMELMIGDFNGSGTDDIAVRMNDGHFFFDVAENGWKDVSSGGDWDTGFKKSTALGFGQGKELLIGNFNGGTHDDIGIRRPDGKIYMDNAEDGWRNENSAGGDWDTGFDKGSDFGYNADPKVAIYHGNFDTDGKLDFLFVEEDGTYSFEYSGDTLENGGTNWDHVKKKGFYYQSMEEKKSEITSQNSTKHVQPGENFSLTFTMKNIGADTWDGANENYAVGLVDQSHNWGLTDQALGNVSVAQGQSKTFTLNLTAPQDVGVYILPWRMKLFNSWFGDITADTIQVGDDNDAEMSLPQFFPDTMNAGQTYTVTVNAFNTGIQTWNPGGQYKLGAVNDDSIWGPTRVDMNSGDSTTTGNFKMFTFDVTAPTTPGTYTFDYQMVQEGVEWFGDSTDQQVTVVSTSPTDITLSSTDIAEGEAGGTEVGTLSTSDTTPGDTFTYELTAGDGDEDNTSFTINGDKLESAEVFDFETKNSYSIRVKTTDSNSNTFEKAFTINVTDVNESFSPTDLTGLSVWLDADQITGLNDGDAVSTWNDASGNSNNATQTDTAKQPTYEVNELNGKPVVKFTSDVLTGSLGSNISNDSMTVIIVAEEEHALYKHTLFGLTDTSGSTLQNAHEIFEFALWKNNNPDSVSLTRGVGQFSGTNQQTFDSDFSGFNIWSVTSDGSDATVNKNGTQFGTTNGFSEVSSADDFILGSRSSFNNLVGDIAEVIVYDRVLTSAELQQVEQDLQTKYNL